MKTKRLLILILLVSIFTVNSNAQNFKIVSNKVKSERRAAANRRAYIAKVNTAWENAKSKNTLTAYDAFLKNKFSSQYNKIATERIFNFATKENTTDSYERFLSMKYRFKEYNDKAKERLFNLVTKINTIAAYETYMSKKYVSYNYKKKAIANIYFLTAEADAVVGYRSFLDKYPRAADAKKATKRLYEIMYAIAEEENDIASYYGFLVQFPKSQVKLRDKAYINMQMLEVEKATVEFQNNKANNQDHELKERIARQLYIEAIRAKEAGDNYTFMRKYNTVLYSDLFKDTKTAFDLFRDKELAKLIKGLVNEIRQVKYSVYRMQKALTYRLNKIDNNISSLQSSVAASRNDYSSYLSKITSNNSSGASSCSYCGGNGWRECPNCGGDGKTGFFTSSTCSSCGGRGTARCNH